MKEGDVVLAVVPQFDEQTKNRPVIVLKEMPRFRDLLVCGISTKLHRQVHGFDEVLSPSDPDFASSGLLVKSLIRVGFLTVLPLRSIAGAIGSISQERHRRLLGTLSKYLMPDSMA